jgi:uncharacterized protein DUF4381
MSDDADIRDIRGPIHLLPGWLWPALMVSAVILALAIYGFWRWRRTRRARVLLPYEIALQRLEDIRTLMQPENAQAFTTAASDIVRGHIEARFAIAVTRRTTEEFLRDMTEIAALAKYHLPLQEFLQQCDFAKFAAMSLTVQDMESLRQSARAFVLATAKPEEAPAGQEAGVALPTA